MSMVGPKDIDEIKLVSFDFSDELEAGETITVATVDPTVASGTDAAPAALLVGLPQVVGTRVVQRVQGGVVGVTYRMRCKATGSGGLRHTVAALMEVVSL